MKIARLIIFPALGAILCVSAVQAAPVESVESAAAKPALQKVDAFLSERAVIAQLTKLGISPEQARTRLAKLDDAQLVALAAQVDQLQAGGDVTGGNPHPLGSIGCVFKQIGITVVHFFKILFCWTDVS